MTTWDDYWKKKSGPEGVYDKIASAYRSRFITRRLGQVLRREFPYGASLLHAGCGSGDVDVPLVDSFRIRAVDSSDVAVGRYPWVTRRPAWKGDVRKLQIESYFFDGVYCLGLLEHFEGLDLQSVLAEFYRVLRPTGRLVAFWPHRLAPSVLALKMAKALTGREFHPPEPTLLQGREHARALLEPSGFALKSYEFGPSDGYIQAVIVAVKPQLTIPSTSGLSWQPA